MIAGGVFIGVAVNQTIPETFSGLKSMFEDHKLQTACATITIAVS